MDPLPPVRDPLWIQGCTAQIFYREQREKAGVGGDPVRHNEKPCQQKLLGNGQNGQVLYRREARVPQMLLQHLFPEGKPKVFFPVPIVVVMIGLYILLNILVLPVLLGLSVVGPCDGGDALWAAPAAAKWPRSLWREALPGERQNTLGRHTAWLTSPGPPAGVG